MNELLAFQASAMLMNSANNFQTKKLLLTMQPKLHALRIIIFLVFFSCTSILVQGQEPSVYTDRKDYSPGDTILIQGDGWLAGERVELTIEHSKVSYGYYTLYATADADGHFHNKEMVMLQFHMGESFMLTASGLGSGSVARTVFTDGTFNSRTSGDWNSVDTWTVSRTGTIRTNSTSLIVEGNGTRFLSELSIGDILTTAKDSSVLGKVKSIESDIYLTLETNASQSVYGGGISYAARKVPGIDDNVVINGHKIAVHQSARCFNLNLNRNASLLVGANVILDITDSLTLSNSGIINHVALLEGEGTINTKYLNVGDNASSINYGTFWHSLKTTVSYFNIAQDVNVRSFLGSSTLRVSNGKLLVASGKVSIGGGVFLYTERVQNEVIFSVQEPPGNAVLILSGRSVTFNSNNSGTTRILFNGAASTVEYIREGAQMVHPGIYRNIVVGGSGEKAVHSIEVYGRLSMQGTATATAISQPKYMPQAALEYKGNNQQFAGSEFPGAVSNLIINNASGVTLMGGDRTINGVLTLANGILNTGPYKVKIGTYGSIKDASEMSFVSGRLEQECKPLSAKEFPLGKGGVYGPVKLEFTTLTGNSNFIVEQMEEPLSGTLPANTALASNRYWKVIPPATSAFDCNITFSDPSVILPQGAQAVILKKNSAIEAYDAEVNGAVYTVKGLRTLGDFGLGIKRLRIPTATMVADASAIYGDSQIEIVASVSAGSGTPPIGGVINFFLQGPNTGEKRSIGEAPVDHRGVATLTFDPHLLSAGYYLIIASYSGYGTFEESSSALPEPGSNGVLTIGTRRVIVAADTRRKTYGENDPELTYKISQGELVNTDYFSGSLSRAEGENAGTYSIAKGSLSLNENYNLEFIGAQFTIERRSITVLAIPQSKVYGNEDPQLTYEVSEGNLAGEDVFQGMLSRAEGEDVGSYFIDQGTFTAGNNYELTFIKSSLTITPAPASIHVSDLGKIYSGAAQGVTVRTIPAGLAVAMTYDGSFTIPINAGTYAVEAVLANSNYKLVDDQGADLLKQTATLVISPKSLTIIVNNKKKVYGTANPVLDGTESGLVSSDGITIRYSTEALTTSDVGEYPITATITDPNNRLGNYSVTNIPAKLTITQAQATIILSNLMTTYDGAAKFATATADPVAAGISVKYFQGSSEVVAPIAAGTYAFEAILANSNYAATPVSGTLVINKAPTSTVVLVSGSIYDGIPHGGTASVTGDGGLNQALAVTYSGMTRAGAPYRSNDAPTEAGDYTAAASYAESDNHLESFDSQPFTISQAVASISVNGLSKVYNGEPQGAAIITTPDDLAVNVSYNGSSMVPINAGSYKVVAVLDNSNYTAAGGSGTLVINKAPSNTMITIHGAPFIYAGVPIKPASVRVTGVGGLNLMPTATYVHNVNAGTATASYSYEGDVNHEPSWAKETFRIDKADATFTINGYTGTYDGEPHQASGTATGVMGENLSGLLSFGVGIANVPGGDASWTFPGNENYMAASGTRAIVLSKADPNVAAQGGSLMYNGTPQPGSGEVKGVKGEYLAPWISISYTGTLNNGTSYSSPDAPAEAGVYTVTANFEGNNNYKSGSASAPLRIYAVPVVSLISPRPVEINTPAVIAVDFQGEVFNASWRYTIGIAGTLDEIMSKEPDGDREKLIAGQLRVISPAVGVYTITLSYENGIGEPFTTTIPAYAVFYDPAAGFVTGGGWVHSPAGAYTADRTLAGKATFGFVSKYEKGRTVPSGNTEFQFHTAKMNFRSTAYEYLVVAGSRAQYKGTGTINGAGNYGFILTGIDGEKDGVGKPDLFRIKIWDKNNGDNLVYDNEYGMADDAQVTTALGGGSIVIHIPPGGRKTSMVSAEAKIAEVIEPTAKEFSLKVFPNPTISSFNVQIKSDETEDKIILRLWDLNGRTIEVINNVSSGQTYSIGANYRPGIYLVEMIQGSRRSQTMLLKGVN